VSKADDYEAKALECLELSDQYLTPGNSSQWVAHVYATQAQVWATLARLHRNDDFNDDVELYNTEVEIFNRSHWGTQLWNALTRRTKAFRG
jgi:hypothetical protein